MNATNRRQLPDVVASIESAKKSAEALSTPGVPAVRARALLMTKLDEARLWALEFERVCNEAAAERHGGGVR